MKRNQLLLILSAVGLAMLLMPLATMAMIPSSCGIFRHWAFLENLDDVKGEEAKGIRVSRFDLDVDGDGRAALFLSSPSAETQSQAYRVMHIYTPATDGKTYLYLGQLALAGFRHDAAASRLLGIEVDSSNGQQTLKAYSVSHRGLVVDPDAPMSSDPSALEKAKAAIANWTEKAQQQWWQADLAALHANVWQSTALTWVGEATGEQGELPNKLFNVKVSWDRSPGKSKAKSECKTMKGALGDSYTP
ncbi:hypothetical protein [Candidatus Entotheonella palauensis]|uniref:hypothetical protein n=1 Tax=Candidatus Entotheonella palauensis TaxID=93172 RepID=UPI000B7CF379|nr:hypothetical protein [Candidatus Entotheonella palauensis]